MAYLREADLPYPPSINCYWRRVGFRTLISREGRRFREDVIAIMAAWQIIPQPGPIEISIVMHPPDRRRRDLDNILKALLDSLQYGGAYADDSQIVKLLIEKREPIKGGLVTVKLWPVEEPT